MKRYDSSLIRNVVLAGHAGSGKTTLSETMLYESGAIARRGNIQKKNTVSDYHEIEKEKEKSVFAAVMNLDWRGTKINLVDTPGTPDFTGEAISCMIAADAAVFVLNSEYGVEVATVELWKKAEELNLPAVLVCNKLDSEQSGFQKTADMAREQFGREVVVVQYPFSEGKEFHAIIDVLKMTMYEFPQSGGRPDKLPIPESQKVQAELLQNELVETIAENDESLMDLYFEHGKLDVYELREGLQKTILNRQIFPMFCMSALRNMGAGRLMGFIGNVLPPPPAAHPVPLTGGGNLKIENNDKPVLFSFKTYAEPHVGNLNYLKVINGPVAQGMDLENRRNQHSQRLSTLSVSQGGKRADITAAEAGDLIVAVKLTDIQTTDTLTEKGRDITVEPGFYPGPTVRKAVELLREGEEDKLGPALHQLLQEDPTLHMEQSPELNQTVLHGLGEEHLTVVHEQLSRRFGLDIRYVKPRIPYRETITRTVRTHYKHKKQSGGAGQYAEVYMILEPWQEGMADSEELSVRDVQEIDLPWGGKLIFRNCIVGGIIDNRFMPAILKGVMEKMEKGPVSGCRARDIRVSVYDGSMHSVDSNDAAFRTAALMAFREGFMKAYPQLMEPVYEVEITVPEMYMGDVMSDLSSRRGQIQGIDSDGPVQKIMANVPLQELDQYSTRLKSMTRGSAFHTLRFSHYNTLPREIQQQVISKHMASEPA